MKKTITLLLTLVIAFTSIMPANANNVVTMYAPDGRTVRVYDYEVSAWQNVGWYTIPVATLYAPGCKTVVVYNHEVEAWKNVGWYPLHSYLFVASKDELSNMFGPFVYDSYYPGIPNSGDFPRTYYNGSLYSPGIIEKISFDEYQYCADVKIKLSAVFPMLALYADSEGKITVEDFNRALGDGGIYGSPYRSEGEVGAFCSFVPLKIYADDQTHGYFDYDQIGGCVQILADKKIDFNNAVIYFYTMT